jgi:hypothetical protein
LLVLLLGCGSATVNGGTGGSGGGSAGVGGATGGKGGAAGSNVNGTGGAAGAAGTSGGAGAAGAGAAGTNGGASGSGTGGAAGGAGATGTAGAGGDGSRTAGVVVCGSVDNCPITSGGQCCYSDMDKSSTCQASGATCDPVQDGSTGSYYIKTTIACDSSNDCPSSQICCYTSVYIGSNTACMAASACVDSPAPTGGYATSRRQVCDPTKVVPSECLSGTCKAAMNFSARLPSYLYLCL